MEIAEALEIVVARTKHERYRELCDPGHADYDAAYVGLVLDLASRTGTLPPTPPPPIASGEAIALVRRMKLCPWRDERADCGCGGMARCAAGLGTRGLVNHQDCFACLRRDEGAEVR